MICLKMKLYRIVYMVALLSLPQIAGGASQYEIADVVEVAKVWSGHPVGFCLLTVGRDQYVAFYDDRRQMTVGSRKLPGKTWRFSSLDEKVVLVLLPFSANMGHAGEGPTRHGHWIKQQARFTHQGSNRCKSAASG